MKSEYLLPSLQGHAIGSWPDPHKSTSSLFNISLVCRYLINICCRTSSHQVPFSKPSSSNLRSEVRSEGNLTLQEINNQTYQITPTFMSSV